MKRTFKALIIALLSFIYKIEINTIRGNVKTNIRGWRSKLVWVIKPIYDIRENNRGEVYIKLKKHNREDCAAANKTPIHSTLTIQHK